MKKLAIIALLLFAAFPLSAQDDTRWYEVEVIIFDHKLQPDRMTEIWPADPGTPDYNRSQPLEAAPVEKLPPLPGAENHVDMIMSGEAPAGDQAGKPDSAGNGRGDNAVTLVNLAGNEIFEDETPALTPFQMVAAKDLKLLNAYERMLASDKHRPLMHFAWRQPVRDLKTSRPVLIYREMLNEGLLEAFMEAEATGPDQASQDNGENRPGTMPLANSENLMVADTRNTPTGNVEGTIRISAGKYLHVHIDLLYFSESAAPRGPLALFASSRDDLLDVYRLKDHRRIRSEQVHYFDHPMFGVLVLATPIELPEKEEQQYDFLQNLPSATDTGN